jgi:hypothetical protein
MCRASKAKNWRVLDRSQRGRFLSRVQVFDTNVTTMKAIGKCLEQ